MMYFNTENQRLQHPQARLIPRNLWNYPFHNVLSQELIPLMQAADNDCLSVVTQFPISDENKERAYLAMALSHPHLEPNVLKQIGNQLNLTERTFFEIAIKVGRLDLIMLLLEGKTPWQIENMIATDDFSVFYMAVENGHLDILQFIEQKFPQQLENIIAHGSIFTVAAENGHLKILQYVEQKAPKQLQIIIATYFHFGLHMAAKNGHVNILQYLQKQDPMKFHKGIASSNFQAFRLAVENDHLNVLQYLKQMAPNLWPEMIGVDVFFAFKFAARNGYLGILQYLVENDPQPNKNAMQYHDALTCAATHGHLNIIQYLLQVSPNPKAMIADYNYSVFPRAIHNGQLEVLEYLVQKAPWQLQYMLAAKDFSPLGWAARNGHLNIMQYLEQKAPAQLQNMIAAENFGAFRGAAQNGHLNIMQYLEQKAPTQLQNMIAADNFFAFRIAAQTGHLNIIQYLEQKAPHQFQAMIASKNFEVFCHATYRIEILQYLKQKAPEQLLSISATENFREDFDHAVIHNSNQRVELFLSYPGILAYAEAHEQEYSRVVYRYISQTLRDLHQQKQIAEEDNPNTVFDVDSVTAHLGFYMLRNLIRRNQAELLDEIRFLLSIPAIKNLASRSQQSNELLRLAISISNHTAALILLNIPAIRIEAQRHNYYREEARGGFDLQALAQNRESSMTALSTGEQGRLKAATDHYNPILQQPGMVSNLITVLKERLLERFEEKPASIERNGQRLFLPMHWNQFEAMDLNHEERRAALMAYFQHKDHTAWRYLSKPNPWMHHHASYVYISDNRQERWATFEDYQSFIALLFLAAVDEKIPGMDGYTLETRFEHFIHELALIGRAHNWDKTRNVLNENNQPILDEQGNPKKEEYDDLEGDRPSCFSGVKRRLFQSVLGHPLLKMLTKQNLAEEIRTFVRQHFKETIPQYDPKALQKAWEDLVLGEQEAIVILKVLDVSEEKQQRFLRDLGTKYGPQFTEDNEFKQIVIDAFKLKNPKQDCHAVWFGYIDIPNLLQKAIQEDKLSEEKGEQDSLVTQVSGKSMFNRKPKSTQPTPCAPFCSVM